MNESSTQRRGFLAAAFASGIAATTGAARAEEAAKAAAHVKGPRVWLDLDQKELDDAYDQSVWATNIKQLLDRYAVLSEATRQRIGAPQRFAYGATPVEAADLYATRAPNAPIQVFIHGGAWRAGASKVWAYPAEMLVDRGTHYIALDFANVIETGGDLMAMANQVRRGIAWIHENAARFGGDRDRIYVSGHSSGAHLAGVALATDWSKEFSLPADVLKGGVLLSGMYELKPVALSARSRYVRFTPETIEALSSQRHLDRWNAPVVVAHAALDTPEFQRQSRDFAQALREAGKRVEFLVAREYNHFEAPETFGNPYGLMGRAMLSQMGLR